MPIAARGHAAGGPDGAGMEQEYVGARGHVITAAVAVLADGLPRSADEICAQALARGLVPPRTSKKYVYTALIEYIARTKGHERKPAIVQDSDRRFRANHPADPWPATADPIAGEHTDGRVARGAGSRAKDGDRAGSGGVRGSGVRFVHDARLRRNAHRWVRRTRRLSRCAAGAARVPRDAGMQDRAAQTAIVTQPNVVEAAKYRATYGAAYCALVGPAFGAQTSFASELAHARRVRVDRGRSRRDRARELRSGRAARAFRARARGGLRRRCGVDRLARRGEAHRRDLRCHRGDRGASAARRAGSRAGRCAAARRRRGDDAAR